MTDALINRTRAALERAEKRIIFLEELIASTDTQLIQRVGDLLQARAETARLREALSLASDPDFIMEAMDSVADMDTTLMDYANAVAKAIARLREAG